MPAADCISAFSVKSLLLLLLKGVIGSPTGAHEQVDGRAASATSVATYEEGNVVRLVATAGNSAAIVFGPGPVTATNVYLAPDVPEYFSINTDTRIAVIGAIVDITVME